MQEQKHRSTCNVSFTRNDLARTKLGKDQCPVKHCTIDVKRYSAPYNKKHKSHFVLSMESGFMQMVLCIITGPLRKI